MNFELMMKAANLAESIKDSASASVIACFFVDKAIQMEGTTPEEFVNELLLPAVTRVMALMEKEGGD